MYISRAVILYFIQILFIASNNYKKGQIMFKQTKKIDYYGEMLLTYETRLNTL